MASKKSVPQKKSTLSIGAAVPHLPWQERPKGCADILWRYDSNPVITAGNVKNADAISNSAAIAYKGGFVGVFRVDDNTRLFSLHTGWSKDGLSWKIEQTPIKFKVGKNQPPVVKGYDPRVCKIGDRYYVSWCNDFHGPTIGIAWTKDFKTYTFIENAFVPFNRNGVLFPRKINGRYMMLNRPSDPGQTAFGDIFLSQSKDLVFWGEHKFVMGRRRGWEKIKIGPGPVPIETKEGWLLIYHGVFDSCNGFNYVMGAALLDLNEPWKVKYRSRRYLLAPKAPYELAGRVPNVVFPVAAIVDAATDRLAVYYGASDSVVGVAFGHVGEIIQWLKEQKDLD